MGGMSLRYFGDPILKQPTVRVAPDTDVSGVIHELWRTLDQHRGLGLAAQQVGSTHRVAIVTFGGKAFVAINLEILERSKASQLSTHEGCLSVRVGGKIFRMNTKRAERVLVRWEDVDRQVHTQRVRGLDAIVAQHEAEHLDGKCIVDRLDERQLERLKAKAVAS